MSLLRKERAFVRAGSLLQVTDLHNPRLLAVYPDRGRLSPLRLLEIVRSEFPSFHDHPGAGDLRVLPGRRDYLGRSPIDVLGRDAGLLDDLPNLEEATEFLRALPDKAIEVFTMLVQLQLSPFTLECFDERDRQRLNGLLVRGFISPLLVRQGDHANGLAALLQRNTEESRDRRMALGHTDSIGVRWHFVFVDDPGLSIPHRGSVNPPDRHAGNGSPRVRDRDLAGSPSRIADGQSIEGTRLIDLAQEPELAAGQVFGHGEASLAKLFHGLARQRLLKDPVDPRQQPALPGDTLFSLPARRIVSEDQDHPDDVALCVQDRRGAVRDHSLGPVLRDEHRVVGQPDDPAGGQNPLNGVLATFPGPFADDVEDISERPAQGLLFLPAGQFFRHTVDEHNVGFQVRGNHPIADGTQGDGQTPLFCRQRGLCPLAFGK